MLWALHMGGEGVMWALNNPPFEQGRRRPSTKRSVCPQNGTILVHAGACLEPWGTRMEQAGTQWRGRVWGLKCGEGAGEANLWI